MNLDELITQTSQQNNVTEEHIRDALSHLEDDWTSEEYIKAMGVLGNAGIHNENAWNSLKTISRLWYFSALNEANPFILIKYKERYGMAAFSAFCALYEEFYGVGNV